LTPLQGLKDWREEEVAMKRKVIKVIDGDTFRVTPDWEWGGSKGNKVRTAGITAPEIDQQGYIEAKQHLEILIDGQEVDLEPIKISYDRLLCKVKLDGEDLADLV
jgi:endonuclease YncB( thermonuclease family)